MSIGKITRLVRRSKPGYVIRRADDATGINGEIDERTARRSELLFRLSVTPTAASRFSSANIGLGKQHVALLVPYLATEHGMLLDVAVTGDTAATDRLDSTRLDSTQLGSARPDSAVPGRILRSADRCRQDAIPNYPRDRRFTTRQR